MAETSPVELFRTRLADELERIETARGADASEKGRFRDAAAIFDEITTDQNLVEFMTLPAYEYLP